MKLKLTSVTRKCLLVAIACSIFSYTGYSQKIKGAKPSKVANGHQLYKQLKIYDSENKNGSQKAPKNVGDKAEERMNYEFELLKNPYTGKVPINIRQLEKSFSKKIAISKKYDNVATANKNGNTKHGDYWVNRGPYNVGGRTRALAIDLDNENVIIAGGVSGGVWRSVNGGQTWRKTTKLEQSPSITAIVQDPRPGHRNVWYYGTGELASNSASATGGFYLGTGVYKSVDGGRNWNILPVSFNRDNDIRFATAFEVAHSMVVSPINGDLYLSTIDGIIRSKDGGSSFTRVLETGFGNWAEIIVTPSGRLYVSIDIRSDENRGFFTSTNGDNWTNITPSNIVDYGFGRTVMAVAESHENIVYFFSQNLIQGRSNRPFLVRYNALATSTAQRWVDLSANLPINIGGRVGNLNLQGRYNMFIRVKPDNPGFVVLGGTNVYRSTTGFTTPAGQESWIGGYSPINNVSTYPDHHPDQHNFIFYPSNPNKALSSNDGGVQVTNNIGSNLQNNEPVDWISLSNGYLTTQAYTVSFNPKGKHFHTGSMDLLAGFQDNGTWFTNSRNGREPWISNFSGDGSYNAIADNGRTRYVSSQNGNIVRFDYDENGDQLDFARIFPTIGNSPQFINPFILDPINDNIMFTLDGNRILRNNNLDEIPKRRSGRTSVNWVAMDETTTPDNSRITALGLSIYPRANRLYYGTNSGGVYRMDNANIDNQEVVDISSGKGLPAGNVINIAVDPSNSDTAVLVFSNYGIPSLFLTKDAGETWTDISSNLEENPDGSGNGPSVRWFAFFGKGQGYFAATSTGLYSTSRLEGNSTRWQRETRIGNNVVTQVKTRRDGFMAVATHGNGLFSSRFAIFRPFTVPKPTLKVTRLLPDLITDENSDDRGVDITDLFVSSTNAAIDIELTNSNPDLVTATIENNILTLHYASNKRGEVTIGLIATSGVETVTEGFTVQVIEGRIYEQVGETVGGYVSQFLSDFNSLAQSSDDFEVPDGSVWTINRILAFGSVSNNGFALNNATVVIYEDDNGVPGNEVYNSGVITPIPANNTNLNLSLPAEVELSGGNYWLTVYENLAFTNNQNLWFWSNQATVNGQESKFKDVQNLFGSGATNWLDASIAFNAVPTDHKFQIFGVSSDSNGAHDEEEDVLAEVATKSLISAWPNPSSDYFNFDFSKIAGGKKSIQVFNLRGQMVFQKEISQSKSNFSWNASGVPSGMYIIKVKDSGAVHNLKVIKN